MIHVVILAGGKSTRMNSDIPKVLIPVNGKSLVERLLTNVVPVCPAPCIVVGYKGEEVVRGTGNQYRYIWQREQLGTGHAMMAAKKELAGEHIQNLVVLLGDHPLISSDTVRSLAETRERENATIVMGTVTAPSYEGDFGIFANFGRVLRGTGGDVEGIVEVKDATPEQREIKEVNLSFYCFEPLWFFANIDSLTNANKAGEYYLTDMVHMAFSQGKKIVSLAIDPIEGMGANTMEELAIIEKYAT